MDSEKSSDFELVYLCLNEQFISLLKWTLIFPSQNLKKGTALPDLSYQISYLVQRPIQTSQR